MSSVTFEGVTKRYPNGFEAVTNLDLDVADGELLVVVGPSGCGKTTTLRMLAGLESITEGTVRIGDETVNNVSARNRDIAMVFQSYALYPHLSVSGNLAYPLKLAGRKKADIAARVERVARQLRLMDLLDRKPRQLSGGQRQRVAMGRAMVREPRVFLMDEPLSNLDAKLRVTMRAEVAELQKNLGTTMFYVTHDQIEAMTLGTRVAVMKDGVLQQCAPPAELYHHPANTFVAAFIGAPPMNLFHGRLSRRSESAFTLTSGVLGTAVSGAAPQLQHAPLDTDLMFGVRPENISISPHVPEGNGFPGFVRLVEMLGSEQIVHVEVPGVAQVVPEDSDDDEAQLGTEPRVMVKVNDPAFSVRLGDQVRLDINAERLQLFDGETGLALDRQLEVVG